MLVGSDETVFLGDLGFSVIADVGNSYTESCEAKACAWVAPELLEVPLTKDPVRPTFASDMYSFGCMCVEVGLLLASHDPAHMGGMKLYSNAAPYGDLQEHEIISRVVAGKHPKRPKTSDRELSGPLWAFVTSCWKGPSKRPSAADAVRTLSGFV